MKSRLPEKLAAAVRGRGVAGLSVIAQAGDDPVAFWAPETGDEPAFLTYSISKTFSAVLVLKLCEEGHLGLDDPLAKWFPCIAQAAQIPLWRLLNHTAGIPDYGGNRAYHDSLRTSSLTPWSFEQFAAETFEKGLRFDPGQGWEYSNPGYMLVKRIVEEAAGMSYQALISDRIARSFGLCRTFVPESIEDLASLAPGTSSMLSADGSPRDVRMNYHPGWVSHGVVASTPSEIVRFLDGIFHGQFLLPRSLEQMMQLVKVPVTLFRSSSAKDSRPRWGKPSYGLGLMGDPASPWGLIVGHNGGGPCYSASAFHAFDLGGASVCAIGAIEDFNAEDVVFGIFDQLAGGGNPQLAEQGIVNNGGSLSG